MALFENTDRIWFGTRENMRWIQAPLSGMESSPEAKSTSDVLLNGSGHVRKSLGSHKVYEMGWSDSETPNFAQVIQAYASGSYGRGKIYFQDPLAFGVNVLPAIWSNPAMAYRGESKGILPELTCKVTPTPPNQYDLPVLSAIYDLPANTNSTEANFSWRNAVFVPIPEGHAMFIGAMYQSLDANTHLMVAPVSTAGVPLFSEQTPLSKLSVDAPNTTPTRIDGGQYSGVALYVRNGGAPSRIQITSIIARMLEAGAATEFTITGYGDLPYGEGLYGGEAWDFNGFLSQPWALGMGNSGCMFDGQPTLVEYTGIGEGQVGLSCTLREVAA